MLENPFYIYRHIRPDTNMVFYVGRGNNLDQRQGRYARAKDRCRRHDFWRKVVAKNDGKFEVEIMFECATEEQCNVKEKEFIALYGRKDLGTGTLVNLTDGGEGATGVVMPLEIRKKHSAAMIGKNWQAKKVIDVETKQIFRTVREAESFYGITKGLLGKYLNGENANKTALLYLDDYNRLTYREQLHKINQKPRTNKTCRKKVVDTATGKTYESLISACRDIGRGYRRVSQMMTGKVKNTTTLKYL